MYDKRRCTDYIPGLRVGYVDDVYELISAAESLLESETRIDLVVLEDIGPCLQSVLGETTNTVY